jgi:hypothetical protein
MASLNALRIVSSLPLDVRSVKVLHTLPPYVDASGMDACLTAM